MKTKFNILQIFVVLLIITFGFVSCSTTKRTAVSCPDISLKKNEYKAHNRSGKLVKPVRYKKLHATRVSHPKDKIRRLDLNEQLFVSTREGDELININKIEFNKTLVASTDNSLKPGYEYYIPRPSGIGIEISLNDTIFQEKCDTIILKTGARIIGKLDEIGQNELKYRRCDNLSGPVISVLKSDVSQVYYSNGTTEHFDPVDYSIPTRVNNPVIQTVSEPKSEGMGIVGFLAAIVGLFVASIPLGTIAAVFGAISLSRINREPHRYKGRGFATAAIIIGIIEVVLMITLLGTM